MHPGFPSILEGTNRIRFIPGTLNIHFLVVGYQLADEPNLYIKKCLEITKHPLKNGCLGSQVDRHLFKKPMIFTSFFSNMSVSKGTEVIFTPSLERTQQFC